MSKEAYRAVYDKAAAGFGNYSQSAQEKLGAAMGNVTTPDMKKLSDEYFDKADVNGDGLLDAAEYSTYARMWEAWMSEHAGETLPAASEADVNAAWEASKISGKDGVTLDDLHTIGDWEAEWMKEGQ